MEVRELAYTAPQLDRGVGALKVPPHSVEAEQSVVGGLLLDNSTWEQVGDMVAEDDFYRREHRMLFRAITDLAAQGIPFDVVTLSERLSKTGDLENAGGFAYIATLARDTPSAANITAYARIVRENSVLCN